MEIEIVNMISSVGFPIVMCVYMATKFEKTINKNTDAIISLSAIIKSWRRR